VRKQNKKGIAYGFEWFFIQIAIYKKFFADNTLNDAAQARKKHEV
jgi:hypothetical protein